MSISTLPSRAPASFPVRRISFRFQDSARYWFDGDAYLTHFMNAMSGIFPLGERYLIRALREVREDIGDPALLAEIRGFIGQEAMHAQEHLAFNRYADEQRIDIATAEREMRRIYVLLEKWLPTMHNMAIGCAIEHITATLGAELLGRMDWNARMAGPVAELWLWHALEENEHKAVFLDAYRAKGGGEMPRMFYMAVAGSFLLLLTMRGHLRLLRDDGALSGGQFLKFLWKFAGPGGLVSRRVLFNLVDYFRPGFHPNDHDSEAVQQHWRRRFQAAA